MNYGNKFYENQIKLIFVINFHQKMTLYIYNYIKNNNKIIIYALKNISKIHFKNININKFLLQYNKEFTNYLIIN